MLGAIIGDIVGSVFEFHNHRSKDFPLFCDQSTFTDDSVLTFATAKVLLDGTDYTKTYQDFSHRYAGRGYGTYFSLWLNMKNPLYPVWGTLPYNSLGNGSAMRVSPVGFAFESAEETLAEARRSAEVTHNHPEGVKGAQATALAIFMARKGSSQVEIKSEISSRFDYKLTRPLDEIRLVNRFDETCQGSVPEAISAFLESASFEDAIRLAISIGGDSDTIACIVPRMGHFAGGIAQAFYGTIPAWIASEAKMRLPLEFLQILECFEARYPG